MKLESCAEGDARVAVIDGEGLASLREWIAAVDGGARQARHGAADALLLDFRKAGFTPSARDASAIVAALLAECGERLPPVAVVTNPGVQYGGARVLCVMGELRGCQAAAFLDDGKAWSWVLGVLAEEIPDQADPGLQAEA